MNRTTFFQLIKEKALHGLYLLHGPEEYTKQSALARITESLDEATRDFNVQSFTKPLADSVKTACETLPFLAERRVVICRDMADSEISSLLAYAPALPDTTVLLLYVRGAASPTMAKQIAALGQEVLFELLDEQEAIRFVLNRAHRHGARLDRTTALLFVDMVGTDVHTMENELNKVIDYAGGGGKATSEAGGGDAGAAPGGSLLLPDFITAVVTPHPDYQRYRMLDDLLFQRQHKGLQALETLLHSGMESAFGLAHFFTGQCKSMLLARLLMDEGVKERDIGTRLKLYSKAARAATMGAKRLSAAALRQAVLDFSEIDYLQVTGRMPGERALTAAVCRYFC